MMIHMEQPTTKRVVAKRDDDDQQVFDSMQCIHHSHPNNNNNPGGICAFCLQEKLGKLVSSSFPLPIQAASSSSSSPSSPSFRSTASTLPVPSSSSSSLSNSIHHRNNNAGSNSTSADHVYHTRSRLNFLKKKKKSSVIVNSASSLASSVSASASTDVTFKRSKSTATPRRGKFNLDEEDFNFSPRRRNGFWSFLYLSASSKPSSVSGSKKSQVKSFRDINNGSPRISTVKPREKCLGSSLGRQSEMVVEENDSVSVSVSDSVSASVSSFERKVSRSRSVGCGSRSFSGDFFERISTGLGDCTLRRVESQREGKNKVAGAVVGAGSAMIRGGENHHHCMKERVKCGGIFGGFSSSSSYIVSASVEDGESTSVGHGISHGRSRSKSWAFASPMRAFSTKTSSSKDNKRDDSDKNTSNLSAIPSLLAVRS